MIALTSLLLLSVIFYPVRFFERNLESLNQLRINLQERSPIYRARALTGQISTIISSISLDKKKVQSLYKYRFFTSLIYKILDYSRTHGGPIRSTLGEIRELLLRQYKVDVKIHKIKSVSKLQFISTSFIIWGFAFFSSTLLNFTFETQFFIKIIVLQIGGIIFEHFSLQFLEKKALEEHEHLIEASYIFYILLCSGVALNTCLKESRIQAKLDILSTPFHYYQQNFILLITNWKRYGGAVKDEVFHFLDEVKFGHEGQLEKFENLCRLTRFATMSLFYFPCFFLVILELMHQGQNLPFY